MALGGTGLMTMEPSNECQYRQYYTLLTNYGFMTQQMISIVTVNYLQLMIDPPSWFMSAWHSFKASILNYNIDKISFN